MVMPSKRSISHFDMCFYVTCRMVDGGSNKALSNFIGDDWSYLRREFTGTGLVQQTNRYEILIQKRLQPLSILQMRSGNQALKVSPQLSTILTKLCSEFAEKFQHRVTIPSSKYSTGLSVRSGDSGLSSPRADRAKKTLKKNSESPRNRKKRFECRPGIKCHTSSLRATEIPLDFKNNTSANYLSSVRTTDHPTHSYGRGSRQNRK
jgi:hypothetical protein